jgi:LuxR family maltose regulon positive regulatory protein
MPVLAYAYATMSLVQIEWNELESAVSNARKSVAMAEQWNQADTLHFTLTCLSNALCAAGELEEAIEINHRSLLLAVNVSQWFYRISACDEVFLNLARGDFSAAAHRLAEIEPVVINKDRSGKFLVAKAALLYALGRYPEVITLLEGATRKPGRAGDRLSFLSLLSFQAIALYALGQVEEALDAIRRCLDLAEPEGFVRVFVARGALMLALLKIALTKGIQAEFIQRMLPAFEPPGTPRKPAGPVVSGRSSPTHTAPLLEPLSQRELEVLGFLKTHLSVEEISSELYVAPSTIRTHIRNIYSKLDVHNRIEAIQKAIELELV